MFTAIIYIIFINVQTPQINLSVAIATYNEESNIVDCLQSVKDIANEIIVVDGMSTDRTHDLARSQGAKVIRKPNQSNPSC